MKFFSLNKVARGAVQVIRRFPFEVVFALVGTIAGCILVKLDYNNDKLREQCLQLLMGGSMGLLLTFAAGLYAESCELGTTRKNVLKVFASVIALWLAYGLHPLTMQTDIFRFLLLAIAFHLLVSFAGFLNSNSVLGFWEFNKALFLRFLTAALYSAVLFLGLSAAVGSTSFLFNLQVDSDIYLILWTLITGLFNTLFFLAEIPSHEAVKDGNVNYPKGLKLFTQYVLIPLATIYVLILLAYEVKILIMWSLPEGLVSTLIIGYAGFGILSILLVYPVKDELENVWIKNYSRYFYLLMIPLNILLFVAIGVRVANYGITEERYFLVVLAIWLCIMTVYFLRSKKQNIKWIPITLFLFTILSVYGPQSTFSVSRKSQQARLSKLMAMKATKANLEERENVAGYLIKVHGTDAIKPFVKNADAIKRHFEDKIGKPYHKYEDQLYTQYNARSEAWDSIVTVITPNLRELRAKESRAEYYQYHSSETGIIVVNQAATIIDIPEHGNIQRFRHRNFSGAVEMTEKGALQITLGKLRLKYGFRKLKETLDRIDSTLPENDDGDKIVPAAQMQETFTLNRAKVTIKFETLRANYAYDGGFSGYIIIAD